MIPLLSFPSRKDNEPSVASRKVLILVALSSSPLKPPISLMDIFQYHGCEGFWSTWVMAMEELVDEGWISVDGWNGHTFLALTNQGRIHVFGMALDEVSQLGAERATDDSASRVSSAPIQDYSQDPTQKGLPESSEAQVGLSQYRVSSMSGVVTGPAKSYLSGVNIQDRELSR